MTKEAIGSKRTGPITRGKTYRNEPIINWMQILSVLVTRQWRIQAFAGEAGRPIAEGVHQLIILQFFFRKLHENERIWTEGCVPLDPPLLTCTAGLVVGHIFSFSVSRKAFFLILRIFYKLNQMKDWFVWDPCCVDVKVAEFPKLALIHGILLSLLI